MLKLIKFQAKIDSRDGMKGPELWDQLVGFIQKATAEVDAYRLGDPTHYTKETGDEREQLGKVATCKDEY